MKIKHIIVLVALAVGIAAVLLGYGNAGKKGTFSEAAETPDKESRVVVTLVPGKAVQFDALKDTERFTFFALDQDGVEKEVVCLKEKPYDFERSESIAVVGKLEGDKFIARDIQLKCPSKYEDEVKDL
jgi:cytochrome c-type biogenesis protein CcmE